MIDYPQLKFRYVISFTSPINIFDVLYPTFIELRESFNYITRKDELYRLDRCLSSWWYDIKDIDKRKEIYNQHISLDESGTEKIRLYEAYGDDPWKFYLYKESKERCEKDKELCTFLILQKIDSYDLQKYMNNDDKFAEYNKLIEEKEKSVNIQDLRGLPDEEFNKKMYEMSYIKNSYNTKLCELLELNEEDKLLLEKVLSSKILQPYIKSHGFKAYYE